MVLIFDSLSGPVQMTPTEAHGISFEHQMLTGTFEVKTDISEPVGVQYVSKFNITHMYLHIRMYIYTHVIMQPYSTYTGIYMT